MKFRPVCSRRLLSVAILAVCSGQAQAVDNYLWTGASGGELTNSSNWAWLEPPAIYTPPDLISDSLSLRFYTDTLPDIGAPYSIINSGSIPNLSSLYFYGGEFNLSGSEMTLGRSIDGSLVSNGLPLYYGGYISARDASSILISNDINGSVSGVPVGLGFNATYGSDLTLDGSLSASEFSFSAGSHYSNATQGTGTVDGFITVNGAINFHPYQSDRYDGNGQQIFEGTTSAPDFIVGAYGNSVIEINSDIINPNNYLSTWDTSMRLSATENASVVINGNVVMDTVELGTYSGTNYETANTSVTVNGDITTSQLEFLSQGSKVLTGAVSVDGRVKGNNFINTAGEREWELIDESQNKIILAEGSIVLTDAAGAILDSRVVSNGIGHQFNLHSYSSLMLDNSGTANSDRFADTMNIALGEGSSLSVLGNSGSAINEVMGAINVASTISDESGSYSGMHLHVGESNLLIDGAGAGATLNADGLQIGILRWLNIGTGIGQVLGGGGVNPALLLNNAPTLNGDGMIDDVVINHREYATYNGSSGVISATTSTDLNTASTSDNVLVNADTALLGSVSVQSLAIDANITGSGTESISVTSGNVLVAEGQQNNVSANLDFGTVEGRLQTFGDSRFEGTVTADNGLSVRGTGNVTVNALALTGGVKIQGASLTVDSDLNLNNNEVFLTQGSLILNGQTTNSAGNLIHGGAIADYINSSINNYPVGSGLVNHGSFINEGIIDYGSLEHGFDNLAFVNNGGTLINQNNGDITVKSLINNGGIITNNASLYAETVFNNGGEFTSSSSANYRGWNIVNDQNGYVNLLGDSRGNISNLSGEISFGYSGLHELSYLTNSDYISNYGRLRGSISNLEGGVFNNQHIILEGYIHNEGVFNNSGTINRSDGEYTECHEEVINGKIEFFCDTIQTYAGNIITSGPGVFNNSGTINSEGLVLVEDGGRLTNSGTINADGIWVRGVNGTTGQASRLSNNTNGRLSGVSLSSGALLSNSGTINGLLANYLGSTVTNNATGVINSLTARNDAVVDNSGTIAGLSLATGATATNSSTVNRSLSVDATSSFTNSGTVNVWQGATNAGQIINEASGTLALAFLNPSTNSGSIQNDGVIENRGDMEITADGDITGTGSYTQYFGSTVVDGSMTQANINIMGGSLGGSGVVVGDLVIGPNGTVQPGNSPGILTIDGDFTLEEDARLNLEIDGTDAGQFDQLIVTGAFSALGRINFTLGEGVDESIFTSTDPGVDPLISLFDIFYVGTEATNAFDLSLVAALDTRISTFAGDVFAMSLIDDGNGGFTSEISAVPVPAAVWLFGSGLIGLIGFAKRKTCLAA